MNARDVMTRKVISVGRDASIFQAAQLMLDNRISGLPVVDDQNRPIGIVSEGDLLRRAETGTERTRGKWLEFFTAPGRLAEEYAHSHGRTVAEVMTPDPCAIVEGTPLPEIVALMETRRIKRLPVVRDGILVGLVTRANLLHALASVTREAPSGSASDSDIREQIIAELGRQPWTTNNFVDVVVHDRVVDLWGAIFDERERQAVRVVAENVPGVRRVIDHLSWVEPLSGMTFGPPGSEPPSSPESRAS